MKQETYFADVLLNDLLEIEGGSSVESSAVTVPIVPIRWAIESMKKLLSL